MFQKLIIAAAFVLNGVASFAQITSQPSNEDKMLDYSPTELRIRTPLYVVNAGHLTLHIPSTVTSGNIVSGNIPEIKHLWVQSIRFIPAQAAVGQYGELGRNGAVIVELKDGAFDKLPADLADRFTVKN